MEIKQALDNYTKVLKKVKKFEEENRQFIDSYNLLKEALLAEELQLKEVVRETKQPIENKLVRVKVAIPYKKWYDGSIVVQLADKKEQKILEEQKVLFLEVDKKKFEGLVSDGKIRTEIMQAAFKEQQDTPRITVERIKDEE